MEHCLFSGYEACKIWCAAKAHYNSDSYDILKYGWSFDMSEESFRLRKDRFTFERLAREYESEAVFKQAVGFYLYDNPKAYIRGLVRPNPQVDSALSRFANLYENFRLDYIEFLNKGNVLDRLIQCDISPEGACMIMDYFNMLEIPAPLDKIRVTALLPKYNAFIGYDKGKAAQIVNSFA